MTVEWRVQVDETDVGSGGDAADSLLDGFMPVARATLEAGMTMEDGCHQANPDASLRIGHAEGVDECAVVADELIAVVRPVARVGVVESEMNHHEVGLEVESLSEFRQLRVGPMAMTEQCGSRVAEVLHLVLRTQQLLQHHGIGRVLTVAQSVAIGHAVAHASHAEYMLVFALCRRHECSKQQEECC